MKQPIINARLLLIGSIGLLALVACPGPDTDTTPNEFTFINKTGLSITGTATIESEAVNIDGINAAASVSVTGGSYGIDGAACQTGAGTINAGQKLRLCAAPPKKFGEESNVSVDVGGTKASFKAIAENLESISFPAKSFDAAGQADSAAVTPSWASGFTDLDVTYKNVTGISGATGGFKIREGACQTTAAKVKKTESIKACATVPGGTANGAKAIVTLEFGSSTTGLVSKSFEANVGAVVADNIVLTPKEFIPVLTIAPSTPKQLSNEITVTGIGSSAPISITSTPGSNAKLYIDGVPKTSPSSVTNGQKIQVEQTSSATADVVSFVTLKVGATGKEVSASYNVKTQGALGPNEFATVETLVDYIPANGVNTPTTGTIMIPDTSPTCKYGAGGSVGPWRKATPAEVTANNIDYFAYYAFKKSGRPKSEWNSCPANWDEAAILAAGDAGQNVGGELRKFGKTTVDFNVAGIGNVTKVELKLKLAHQSRADLLMTLVSPTGTRVVIFDLEKDSLGGQIRNTQFSNPNAYNEWRNGVPNGWANGENLFESAGISIIFDDAAVAPANDNPAWSPVGDEAATLRYRCGQNDRTTARLSGNSLGACWNNGNGDGKANFPGMTGFGSFARVRPSNPLSAFVGKAINGTWKLEIEDRAPGNQESNDDAFPPDRPVEVAGQQTSALDTSVPRKLVTSVIGDDTQLVRQPAIDSVRNTPKLRVAVLSVK
jgi:Proprotein convertase P-domain